MKTKYEVADIFRLYGKEYQKQTNLSYKKLNVMHKITICRTSQLGVISNSVINVVLNGLPITPAETGTAPNARPWLRKNGLMTGKLICCPAIIFIWFSLSHIH